MVCADASTTSCRLGTYLISAAPSTKGSEILRGDCHGNCVFELALCHDFRHGVRRPVEGMSNFIPITDKRH